MRPASSIVPNATATSSRENAGRALAKSRPASAIVASVAANRRSAAVFSESGPNATNAANWALTILVVFGLCAVYFAVMVSIEEFRTAGFFPIGAVIIVFFVLAIAHLIVTVAGTIAAATRVFRAPIAIPFLR